MEYDEFRLECLPIPVVNVILCYLDVRSMLTLSVVSKPLRKIVHDFITIKSSSLLVTNQVSSEIKKRSFYILPDIHKYRSNFYWKTKHYNQFVFLRSVERFRPWLQLNSKALFVSQGSKILFYKRNKTGVVHRPCIVFKEHKDDVVRFVVRDCVMISGGNDGKICYWETDKGKPVFSVKTPIRWSENLYTDFRMSTVAAGFSFSGEVKFMLIKENGFTLCRRIVLNETLRSISLSRDASLCALGSSGYNSSPLKILDVDSGIYLDLSGEFKIGAGVYDIIWETPHVLLTGGYDTMLYMWDIRVGQRVRSWGDPFDTAIYTLATDYNCTIMTGSSSHSRITLWDKRHSAWVQTYCVSKKVLAGPVYSFDFDPSFMFVALDKSFHVLDFSGSNLILDPEDPRP